MQMFDNKHLSNDVKEAIKEIFDEDPALKKIYDSNPSLFESVLFGSNKKKQDMKVFNKTFLSIYEPIMLKIGFRRKGKIFHRLVNEKIIQMLSYTTFSGCSFTIQFRISPLCAGYEYTTFMDEERLGILLGNETYAEWDFDGSNCMNQMQESLEICKKYLLPYFEKINDYEKYFEYIENLKSTPYGGGFYEIYLKLGKYEMLKEFQNENLKQIEYAIKRNKECGIEPTSEKIERIERRRKDYELINKIIESNDREYIENYIREKQQYSLESYLKNFK